MFRKNLFVAALLTVSLCAVAQQREEQRMYSDAAGEKMVLYRGREAHRYSFVYNGTYFWDSTVFDKGTVCYNGKVYYDILLNLDAARGELVVKPAPGNLPIAPDRDYVAWFTKGDKSFVNLKFAGIQGAPDGFLEPVSLDGRILWRQVTKTLYSQDGNHNGPEGIGYDDPDYREKVLTYFSIKTFFWEVRNGVAEKVKVRKSRSKAIESAGIPPEFRQMGPYTCSVPLSPTDGYVRTSATVSSAGAPDSLPAGWFDDGEPTLARAEMLRRIEENNAIAEYRNKTYVIGIAAKPSPREVTVSGCVRDISTGEPLAGVSVYDDARKIYSLTDKDGRYSITLPSSARAINYSEYTREDMRVNVVLHGNGGLDVVMKEKVTALSAAMVSADAMADHRTPQMGLERINIKTVMKIPSAFGEGDIVKAVLTLPGVKTVGEAASGFNVRGGSSDQNLILFNEGTVFNPGHMFGIVSSFNSDVIEGVELYKSSIPAEFGGRISSVLEIKGKEGNREKVKGSLGIGLLTSRAEIDGPIGKKTTFVLGGRTTYSNWLMGLLPKNSSYSGGKARFSDVNASVTHHFDARNSLKANVYWSSDKFSFSADTTFHYSNLNASLIWRHGCESGTELSVSGGFDSFANTLEDYGNKAAAYSLETAVRQGYLKAAWRRKAGNHSLAWGAASILYGLNPGVLSPYGDGSLVARRSLDVQAGLEPSIYASDTWKINDLWSVDAGLRLSSFLALKPAKFYFGPEVRLSAKYTPVTNFSLKAGFNTMTQYIHLISNTSSISPMDTWRLCGARTEPQRGWQAAAGAYWTVADSKVDLSAEIYWKQTTHSLDYKSGAVLSMNENLADDLVQTRGRAYGIELMARKTYGKLTGWVSYTYSRSKLKEMQYRGVETINGGAWYAAPHDKPHDFKLVGNYKFTHRYSLSMNIDCSTGRPVTIPVGMYYYENGMRLAYSARNGYRIPDYFRMDLAVNIDPGHYLKAFAHMSVTVGVYNVTGRKNAYSVYYNTSGSAVNGYMISVFATQVPYLTLNILF